MVGLAQRPLVGAAQFIERKFVGWFRHAGASLENHSNVDCMRVAAMIKSVCAPVEQNPIAGGQPLDAGLRQHGAADKNIRTIGIGADKAEPAATRIPGKDSAALAHCRTLCLRQGPLRDPQEPERRPRHAAPI